MNIKNYNLRKASLLDISFIFYLIMDGSFEGSFADFFLTSNGYFFALIYLLLAVLLPLRFLKDKKEGKLFIFTLNDEDIGFLKIKYLDERTQLIDMCAIVREKRNEKHGTQMIRMYLDNLRIRTEVIAYCTKYSRAMQHIFVKQQFKRDKNSYPLECYRFRNKTNTPA
jgi:hypothetical protein